MPVHSVYASWWKQRSKDYPFQCETTIMVSPPKVEAAIAEAPGERSHFISAASQIHRGRVWGFATEDMLLRFKAVYGGIIV